VLYRVVIVKNIEIIGVAETREWKTWHQNPREGNAGVICYDVGLTWNLNNCVMPNVYIKPIRNHKQVIYVHDIHVNLNDTMHDVGLWLLTQNPIHLFIVAAPVCEPMGIYKWHNHSYLSTTNIGTRHPASRSATRSACATFTETEMSLFHRHCVFDRATFYTPAFSVAP